MLFKLPIAAVILSLFCFEIRIVEGFSLFPTKTNNNLLVVLFAGVPNNGNMNDMILAEDEPLSSRFQRAVVLQRAGDHRSALTEYQTFIKAAESCDVSPELYAEVHVNMGAIYTKLKDRNKAKQNFQKALFHRQLGSAHVNLALLALADGQMSRSEGWDQCFERSANALSEGFGD
jgi:tetratricopeptide (TPR) repeat protein